MEKHDQATPLKEWKAPKVIVAKVPENTDKAYPGSESPSGNYTALFGPAS